MRFAVISDIHGNLGALESVLSDIEARQVEFIVNLGDLVSGPLQPRETADRLAALELPTIRGNHDRALLTLPPDEMGASDRFALSALRVDQLDWLATLPGLLELPGDVFACHGTPDSDTGYFLDTVEARGSRPATQLEIEERAAVCCASLILCGHSHLPRTIRLGDGRIILNPGSVGLQAHADDSPHPHKMATGSPHARYAIAEQVGREWSIEPIRVEYDWEAAARLAEENDRSDWAVALRTGRV